MDEQDGLQTDMGKSKFGIKMIKNIKRLSCSLFYFLKVITSGYVYLFIFFILQFVETALKNKTKYSYKSYRKGPLTD